MERPPTRSETAFGALLIIGALALGVRWVAIRSAEPEPAPNPCADAAAGRRRVADREFELAQGVRTGSMSAVDVRGAIAELAQWRDFAEAAETECAALTTGLPHAPPASPGR